MRKNNQGLTLIELVVTVAIIAIFSGVVLSIVSTTSNSFRTTSSTAKVQMETQELLDTIQDLVIDANRSVYYSYGASGSSTGTGIENDIDQEAGDAASVRSFYVCNVKEISGFEERCMYDVLRWDPASQRLTYSYHEYNQQKSDTTGNENNGTQTAAFSDDSLSDGQNDAAAAFLSDDNVAPAAEAESAGESILAENVVSFRADTTKVQSQYIVRFRITLNERGKEITTLHTVNLRNKIKVAPPDQAFPESTPQPVSVKIVEAPTTVRVGEGGRIVAQGFGFSGYESYVWSVDDDSVATIQGNGKEYQLVTKKAGIVTITVTATDRDGRSASASVAITVIEEQKKLDRLEISGLDVVASEKEGTTYDLGKILVRAYSSEEQLETSGNITWYCSGNDYVVVNGQNLIVKPEAWNAAGPLGPFSLWAESLDVPGVKSNELSVSIARLKIISPSDNSAYDLNDVINCVVELFVGNDTSEEYILSCKDDGLSLEGRKFTALKKGSYTIMATATVGSINVINLSDNIDINVKGNYTLQGADYMAEPVADAKNYILNGNPNEISDDNSLARMYWVEDDQGNVESDFTWQTIRDGNILWIRAAKGKNIIVNKKVTIVSLRIDKPDYVEADGGYNCSAIIDYSDHSEILWSADKGEINGYYWNLKNVSGGTELTLTAKTRIMISNSKVTDVPFELIDKKSYYVIADKGNEKWRLRIIQVGVDDKEEIGIPSGNEDIKTYIRAVVNNPGNDKNDFSKDAIDYVWSLYIPALSITLYDNDEYGTSLPKGSGSLGAYAGEIIIRQNIFPEGIIRLPGILTVECKSHNGQKLHDQIRVTCVIK